MLSYDRYYKQKQTLSYQGTDSVHLLQHLKDWIVFQRRNVVRIAEVASYLKANAKQINIKIYKDSL